MGRRGFLIVPGKRAPRPFGACLLSVFLLICFPWFALVLGLDSLSILFNHRSFQKPGPFPLSFRWFPEKKDPWKEWGS